MILVALASMTSATRRGRELETTVDSVAALRTALGDVAIARIAVAPGHYQLQGAALSISRDIVIEAEVLGSVVLDADVSDGEEARVLDVQGGEVRLVGLNITGGRQPERGAGGVFVQGNSRVTFSRCNIYENEAQYAGGVMVYQSDVFFYSCHFFANQGGNKPSQSISNLVILGEGSNVCFFPTILTSGTSGTISLCPRPPSSPPGAPPSSPPQVPQTRVDVEAGGKIRVKAGGILTVGA